MMTNYFDVFGLPTQFSLDAQELARRHRERIRERHPDRFVQGSSQDRRLAAGASAQLNDGLKVLRDPVSRARHLLELHGISTGEETDTAMAPQFLAEQMAWREELEACGGDQARVEALLAEVEAASAIREQALAESFREGDSAALMRARNGVRELQFLRRFGEELDAARTEVS